MTKLYFLVSCIMTCALACGGSGGEDPPASDGAMCEPPTEGLEDCVIPIERVVTQSLAVLCESRCTRIDGDLRIYQVKGLKDLKLLRNIREIRGGIDIEENPDLESLEGLGEITMTDPDDKTVQIFRNPKLRNTKGLGGVKNINGLEIDENEMLESVDETDHITELGYLMVAGSKVMTVLKGFDNLTKVETFQGKSMSRNGRLSILSMAKLEEIQGFGKLENTPVLTVYNNPKLSSIKVFESITAPMRSLDISENAALSTCDAEEFAKRFPDLKTKEITGNKPCP